MPDMTMQQLDKWLKNMGKAWEEKNPKAIPPLFADTFEYYETPFEKPFTSKKQLIKLWQDVPISQKDIQFKYDIVSLTQDLGIAHWTAEFTRIKEGKKAHLDGIFLIKLNTSGLCTLFRQWWVSKE